MLEKYAMIKTTSDQINVLLADNQYITAAGWKHLLNHWSENISISEVSNKTELIRNLESSEINLVVLDYLLFDFNDLNVFNILQQRFSNVHWLFFSDEMSEDFVKQIILNSNNVSFLLKDSYTEEYHAFLKEFQKGNRYICTHISNLLLSSQYNNAVSKAKKVILTATETEILKEISLGKTTKEIAEKRHISVHTVMTHRKNIFRKIEVNSVHEATKYAMRAGIVEMAEYYI